MSQAIAAAPGFWVLVPTRNAKDQFTGFVKLAIVAWGIESHLPSLNSELLWTATPITCEGHVSPNFAIVQQPNETVVHLKSKRMFDSEDEAATFYATFYKEEAKAAAAAAKKG